jgi:hypothetical protein
MEGAGYERQMMSASLQTYLGGTLSSTSVVNITYQLPGMLRIDSQSTGRAIVFDGRRLVTTGGAVQPEDSDLVESLVNDTVEGFIGGQYSGSKTARWFGPSFRIVDKRTSNGLSGVCSLYQFDQEVPIRGAGIPNPKRFCFDSDTQLLKSTSYNLNGRYVETRFDNWVTVGNQVVPGLIERLANGAVAFKLTLGPVKLSPAVADDLFTIP